MKTEAEVRVMRPPAKGGLEEEAGRTLLDGEIPGVAWLCQPLDLRLLASTPWKTHSVAVSPSFVVFWYKSLRELKPDVQQPFLGYVSLGTQLPASELQFPELGIMTSTPGRRCTDCMNHSRQRGQSVLSPCGCPALGPA